MSKKELPFDIDKMPIYVSNTQSFKSNFKSLVTNWKNKSKANDIRKAKFDHENDPYFASLTAAYLYKNGNLHRAFYTSKQSA